MFSYIGWKLPTYFLHQSSRTVPINHIKSNEIVPGIITNDRQEALCTLLDRKCHNAPKPTGLKTHQKWVQRKGGGGYKCPSPTILKRPSRPKRSHFLWFFSAASDRIPDSNIRVLLQQRFDVRIPEFHLWWSLATLESCRIWRQKTHGVPRSASFGDKKKT